MKITKTQEYEITNQFKNILHKHLFEEFTPEVQSTIIDEAATAMCNNGFDDNFISEHFNPVISCNSNKHKAGNLDIYYIPKDASLTLSFNPNYPKSRKLINVTLKASH